MEIFKWAKDIEQISENLIKRAKEANLKEIQKLREEQENLLEVSIQKKQNFVDSVKQSLSNEINDQISIFESNLLHRMKNIEAEYLKNKKKLIGVVLKCIGFDFNE